MQDEELLDILAIARCMYANGKQYISDAEYDDLVCTLKSKGYFINPIYEDDPVPYESFSRVLDLSESDTNELLGLKSNTASSLQQTSFFGEEFNYELLNESASLSIASVTTFREAYAWFVEHQDIELVISTKIDGINTRRGYRSINGFLEYQVSLTRGRKSDPINITENMRKISPTHLKSDITEDLIVYSETVVPTSFVSMINEKYGDDYTVPRGLAMSMMRVADKFSLEDYENLHSFVFRVDYGDKQTDGLELAEKLGFETVPRILYTYKGESFETFQKDMEAIIQNLKQQADSIGIVTDGMVAEVNDRAIYGCAAVTNNYSSANIALKIGLWQPGVYESEVVALDLTQQAERCACVAIVKPVIAAGGQTISRVNCFNPATLFANNILPGSKIRFEYKNETTVNLIT